MGRRLKSWVESANSAETDFPLNNLPYGVFSSAGRDAHCGVAIGDMILDVTECCGLFGVPDGVFEGGTWNAFMALGEPHWSTFRTDLTRLLSAGFEQRAQLEPHIIAQSDAKMLMPFAVSEFTDFYASLHHATNVGMMFRGAENALPPNWLHMPIGYNGRASSVVVSGTEIQRPFGQVQDTQTGELKFAPSERFDMELELGAIVGQSSKGRLRVDQADLAIFGYVLLNDWSARDIQTWEYRPLGPFQAKATATTISPWIVTSAALDEFRVPTPLRKVPLLDHLKETGPMLYDIDLTVDLITESGDVTRLSETNYRELYFSAAQMLAHHSSSGCPMRVGDLLGSGTISGPKKRSRGSMLELSWGGADPLTLSNGASRSFLEDGDTIKLGGAAVGPDYRIGFGECLGTVVPAA